MFEKNLSDLIRGIRANKSNPQKYIATCIDEIKEELKRPNDPDLKSTAVLKLVYLQMLGYDISWADFHIVEVMSLPKFHHKRIGYLAATQSFRQDTDVLMLCTNLIKKDLTSTTPFDSSVALSSLSIIVTSDLGRDLIPDLVTLLSHSKPYIRKKAVLVLYKVFLKYPDGLRIAWDRLKERLEDDDPGVVSATVTVICELAKKNPKNYLTLAPQLFFLLTASSNNWMLIKLIKMFASLTPLEPRLARKLLPPLTQLIQTSNAVSLLYECIYTVIVGGMTNPPDPHNENSAKSTGGEKLARLCVVKLKPFLEENDQNLKYVGLVAMAKLLEVHPRLILQSQELILRCVDDQDITIRMRSLDIISRMVTADSLQAIVKHLLTHLFPSTPSSHSSIFNEPHYHRTLINLIVSMCSRDHYANLTDPEWYIQILLKLISIPNIDVEIDATIGEQLLDICIRGEALRKWAVQQLIEFLKDFCAARRNGSGLSLGPNNSSSVKSIAWIVGEYCGYHSHPFEILRGLLDVAENGRVENETQTVIVHNVLKVYTFWSCSLLEDLEKSLDSVAGKIDEGLGITDGSVGTDEASEFIKVTNWLRERTKEVWNGNTDLEVVERVRNVIQILYLMPLPSLPLSVGTSESATQPTSTTPTRLLEVFKPIFADLHSMFFSKQFHPVAPGGQRMIPIPEGLDLESWIDERAQAVEVMNDDIEEELIHMDDGHGVEKEFSKRSSKKKGKGRKKHRSKSNKENDDVDDLEAEQRRKERQERLKNDPFYIQDTSTSASESLTALESLAPDIVNRSEIVKSKEEPLVIPMKRRSKKSKPSKAPYSIASSKPPTPLNRSVGLLPENAVPMTSSHFMNADESATSVLQRSHSGYVDTSIDNDENRLKSVDLTVEQSVQERSNLRPYNEILKEKKTGKSKTAEKPKIKSKDRGRKKKSKRDVSGSVLEQEQKRILLLRTVDENIQATVRRGKLGNDGSIELIISLENSAVSPKSITLSMEFKDQDLIKLEKSASISRNVLPNGGIEESMCLKFEQSKLKAICDTDSLVVINVEYNSDNDTEKHQNLSLPLKFHASHFVVPVSISPDEFASFLSSDPSQFKFSASTTLAIPQSPSAKSFETIFQRILEVTNLAVVESVNSVMSVWGEVLDTDASKVAGLVKSTDDENESDTLVVKLELKSCAKWIVDGIIQMVENQLS